MIHHLRNKKKIEDTHKLYSADDFVFNTIDIQEMSKLIEKLRTEFELDQSDKKIAADFDMMMYVLPLFWELKHYYNNDFCIAVVQAIVASKKKSFDRRTKSFYFENAIIRIASIWEYLFIILNEFLQTGLIVGKDVKELLIDARCHNIEFIPNGKGYDIRYTPIDSEERKRVEPKLRKKFKLFKISSRKSSNLFLKTIKKQYAKKDRIQFICDLFNSDEAKTVINLRNEIVHRRPLSARFSLAPNELVPGVSVRMNPEGWYDYATLPQLLEKNLFVVRDAIKILYELIFYNDVPNSKENETKRFEALVVRCKPCNKEILINSLSTDYLIKIAHPLICPTCKSDNTEIVNRMKVHERFFFSNFWNYSDFLIQYWESTEVNSKL